MLDPLGGFELGLLLGGAVALVVFATAPLYRVWSGIKNRSLAMIRVLLALLGLAGFWFRAFPLKPGKDIELPVLDATTLAWLAPVLLAFFLPRIASLEVWGMKLVIEELKRATQTAVDFEALLGRMIELLERWTAELALYRARLNVLTESGTDEDAASLMANFFRDRFFEAHQWLDAAGDGTVRLSAWAWDSDEQHLEFYYSREIQDAATMAFLFPVDRGICGLAFGSQRIQNIANVQRHPAWVRIRNDAPSYNAILAVPMTIGNEHFGVLAIDSTSAAPFGNNTVRLAQSLATLCALAFRAYDDCTFPDVEEPDPDAAEVKDVPVEKAAALPPAGNVETTAPAKPVENPGGIS
ncbi:MAG: hypothetical protein QOD51_1274 [Candidatus Eremiobacteraeota bacterium]|jgi:hypothetical protein|nr:hypothetical protein [Candidatus Eremiobacteraeota bacterium]